LAIGFFVLAIIAGILGARGVAGMSMDVAKWLVINIHHTGCNIAHIVAACCNFFGFYINLSSSSRCYFGTEESRSRQCLILIEMNVLEVKMVECIFCGSLIAAGRFVVPGSWICSSCIIRLEEPLNWNTVGCRA
jgi:hypothetical protein